MRKLENNLEKLKIGCLLRSIQKEMSEPENIAIGQISKELRYLQRHSEYANEIERVLKELGLTVKLIEQARSSKFEGVSPQELLIYYQGIFLTLVHQMKDKLTQLINLVTEDTIPEKPSIEENIRVSKLLNKKQKILQTIGIEEEVKQWDQDNTNSKIAVVLRKRTLHHHLVSKLVYDQDFLNLNFTATATQPNFQEGLSDYGKKVIEKIKLESEERFFNNALTKTNDTLNILKENIEKISLALVEYLKLPISEKEMRDIIDNWVKMLNSFDIVNKSSIEKIPEPYKTLLTNFVRNLQEQYKSLIVAVYLVGSLGRGEYEEGYSDVNLYVIIDSDKEYEKTPEEILGSMRYDWGLNLRVFSKLSFLSDGCKKYRIIAKSDGVLLCGFDLLKDEKIPKAGMFLAEILNNDILDNLNNAQKWIKENPSASPLQISKKSRFIAKRIIDFMYGIVISNKPQFTSNREERAVKINNDMYPKSKEGVNALLAVTKYGIDELDNFGELIEGFRPKAEEGLKKMQDVKAQLEKKNPKVPQKP